jgi:glutamate racemase
VARRAYGDAIRRIDASVRVDELAASLFVALAEEGWTSGPLVDAIVQRVLAPLQVDSNGATDCVVLGCTHFPLLADAIRRALPPTVTLIDSASSTARTLADALGAAGLLRGDVTRGSVSFLATDDPERFARVGAAFLGVAIDGSEVERVDL